MSSSYDSSSDSSHDSDDEVGPPAEQQPSPASSPPTPETPAPQEHRHGKRGLPERREINSVGRTRRAARLQKADSSDDDGSSSSSSDSQDLSESDLDAGSSASGDSSSDSQEPEENLKRIVHLRSQSLPVVVPRPPYGPPPMSAVQPMRLGSPSLPGMEPCYELPEEGSGSRDHPQSRVEGLDLDLAYVTPRIIMMGFPRDMRTGPHRLGRLKRFVSKYHGDHIRVYNVAREAPYSSDRFAEQGGSVVHVPVDKHNPTRFDRIVWFCEDAADFLQRDPLNVIAVHCKGGSSRTGLFIACALLYFDVFQDAESALKYYPTLGTAGGRIPLNPSQRRFVQYMQNFLQIGPTVGVEHFLRPKTILLKSFLLSGAPTPRSGDHGTFPYYEIQYPNAEPKEDVEDGESPYFTVLGQRLPAHIEEFHQSKSMYLVKLSSPIVVSGDVRIVFYDYDVKSQQRKSEMFFVWINTGFLSTVPKNPQASNATVIFSKSDLDGPHKDTAHKLFPANFQCELVFSSDLPKSRTPSAAFRFRRGSSIVRPEASPIGSEQYDADQHAFSFASSPASSTTSSVSQPAGQDDRLSFSQSAAGSDYSSFGNSPGGVPAPSSGLLNSLMKKTTNRLRGVVSKGKKRFKDGTFDLDLSYITPRIIAMGFPSEGKSSIYRNKMRDVQRFLQTYHDRSFKVYNLCNERTYPDTKFTTLGGTVACYPFDDHNPSNFRLMVEFCKDATEFLSRDSANVIAIHCKGGKGRTGLYICATLLWMGLCKSAGECMKYYSDYRTNDGRGVTGPSQRRYVEYMDRYIRFWRDYSGPKIPRDPTCSGFPVTPLSFPWAGEPLSLKSITLTHPPYLRSGGGCYPYFDIKKPDGTLLYELPKNQVDEFRGARTCRIRIKPPSGERLLALVEEQQKQGLLPSGNPIQGMTMVRMQDMVAAEKPRPGKRGTAAERRARKQAAKAAWSLVLSGDLVFTFYDLDVRSGKIRSRMFFFWLHTNFIPPSGRVTLQKAELDDAHKDKKHKIFKPGFSIEAQFSVPRMRRGRSYDPDSPSADDLADSPVSSQSSRRSSNSRRSSSSLVFGDSDGVGHRRRLSASVSSNSMTSRNPEVPPPPPPRHSDQSDTDHEAPPPPPPQTGLVSDDEADEESLSPPQSPRRLCQQKQLPSLQEETEDDQHWEIPANGASAAADTLSPTAPVPLIEIAGPEPAFESHEEDCSDDEAESSDSSDGSDSSTSHSEAPSDDESSD